MPRFFYQRDRDAFEQAHGLAPLPRCADCGTEAVRHSSPVNGGRWLCDADYRWRAAHGLEFDPRNRLALEREVA